MSHDLIQFSVCRKGHGHIDLTRALSALAVQMPVAEDDVVGSTFQGERPRCQETLRVPVATNAFIVERQQSGEAYLLLSLDTRPQLT